MYNEYGYQRSGKKCREKFENLYKYYKKTKEGKAARQDGKHYRFFRQLEALYGENINHSSIPETNSGSYMHLNTMNTTAFHANLENVSLSLTNSTDFDTSSSENDDDNDHSNSIEGLMEMNNEGMDQKRGNKRKSGRCWKVKIKDFIDSQMRKLMEKQDEWLDKLVKTMEQKEKGRVLREEEWRKQEVNRLEREHKFWAKERAWIEARDATLMDALQKLTRRHIKVSESHEIETEIQNNNENHNEDGCEIMSSTIKVGDKWKELEITKLEQLRGEMETWEEIANKMTCYGYQRTALMWKEKWESMEGNKKRKENPRSCFYFDNNDNSSLYNQGSTHCDINDQRPKSSSPSNSNVGHADNACFPLLMSEGGNLWEN
ncbi:hypothetical protein Lalb_Chr06g0173331 [Lupinus albus]|uniref:Myb/SANT-like DNA-binding domain-containing protein n=1 Tax=Lupinus albus TaxID=3870 RepID=A0A6A4QEH8_LUPAL|nr:hypothetical protein Lalb_Chr06g0173331 [Lupinus albus]